MDAGWAQALASVADRLADAEAAVERERADGIEVLPERSSVLRAFDAPLDDVRVLIVGQDPYPNPGHPIGLSFAVDRGVRPLPASLRNIYRELHDDLGIAPAPHGDLSAWSQQGVLLLNRILTVRAGGGSHAKLDWQSITDAAVDALVDRGGPLVAILWGRQAQELAPLLPGVPIIASAHPSPLSARSGFFGSRPFSRANLALTAQGAKPVDWRVDADEALLP